MKKLKEQNNMVIVCFMFC